MALSGEQFSLSAGDFAATVVEVGAGLRQLRHRGEDVTVPYGTDELPPKGDGAVLVPWPNRLRGGRYTFGGSSYQLALTDPATGNAIHGLGRWARWSAVRHEADAVTLGIDLVPQTGWLFEIHVEITYALDAARGLHVRLAATNTGSMPAPFGAGCHPYVALHGHRLDDVTVRVPAEQRLVLDDAQIPIGTQPVEGTRFDLRTGVRLGSERFDDGFAEVSHPGGRGEVDVATPSGGARIWFDEAFHYLQVFTFDELRPGVGGVAVEPMTCPADAFNSGTGLLVLQPSESWSGQWGIELI
ncbi:MAG: aldose 1-epimerase family protein [Actinobacteria bacterium]|nr:aldose 1-epimerase family protein [Actinomycetota bacterium]